ncbi:MAG: hypothetical protein KKC80_08225 [Candidatus Margulisbacteria bacterium]|nr:hypothetical protein [Candidatus Margulisiibacteriota bacterium]
MYNIDIMIPQQKRKHADFEWLNKNIHKLQAKHSGKFIAVVNKQVNLGKTAIEAYQKSKDQFPDQEPLMDVIPSRECLLL